MLLVSRVCLLMRSWTTLGRVSGLWQSCTILRLLLQFRAQLHHWRQLMLGKLVLDSIAGRPTNLSVCTGPRFGMKRNEDCCRDPELQGTLLDSRGKEARLEQMVTAGWGPACAVHQSIPGALRPVFWDILFV